MCDDYKPAWRVVDGAIEELVLGGQVLRMSSKSRNAEIDGGPFYSGFDLSGETIDEMKDDAIRQGYAKMLAKLEDYRKVASDLGVALLVSEQGR